MLEQHKAPSVAGRLDYELNLDKVGRVRGVSMRPHTLARSTARGRSGVRLPKLRACVEKHLRAVRFGAGPGGARVSLSLRFGRSAISSLFGSSGLEGSLSGLGQRGTGRGGGGTERSIGRGRSGTIDRARGGYSNGASRLRRRSRRPRVLVGSSVVKGALDKAIVHRVIRRHLMQIRNCYERELIKQPKLAGGVVVRFVIGAAGLVQSVRIQRGIGASRLEQCVIGRFRRMRFPSPKGGGLVVVTYPFTFTPK